MAIVFINPISMYSIVTSKPLAVTIIANLIGALIFFPIDNWIFNRKNKKNITG